MTLGGRVALSTIALVATALATGRPARADPQSMAPNYPVQIEDAFVVPYGDIQLQGDQLYTRNPAPGSHGYTDTPELVLKAGPLKGLQVDLSAPYTFGSAKSPDNGLVTADALYNFNPDTTYVPAFALHAIVQTGYGADTPSTQYTLRAIASKYLGSSDAAPRLHVNVQWTHVTGAPADARSDQYAVLVGYSQLLTRKLAVVTDFVHGQQPGFRKTEDVIDVGLNYEVNDRWSIAGGVGAGVAQQSPDHRIFLAFQRNFKVF